MKKISVFIVLNFNVSYEFLNIQFCYKQNPWISPGASLWVGSRAIPTPFQIKDIQI